MRGALLGVAVWIAPSLVAAQGSGALDAGPLALGAAVTAKAGTHETTVGLRLHAETPLATWSRHVLLLRGGVGAEVLFDDLGIPGASVGAQPGVELAYAFGAPVQSATSDVLQRSVRRHEVAYFIVSYLDTDRTSQWSGGIRYRHATAASTVEVAYENDSFAHQLLDRYRTAAIRVQYLRTDLPTPTGVGLRAVLWTGTTEGLGRLGRDEVYDLSEQYGGAYPHGILALDVVRGGVTLSLGVDSEAIRSAIQNSFHTLIDDGQIPRLAGRPAQVFVRLALNEGGGLY